MESEEGLAARESMAVDLENEALAGTVDATDVLQMKTEYKSWEPSLEAEEVPEESSKDPIGEVLIQTWVLEEDRITEYNDNINDEEGINPEEANIGAEAELVVGTEPDGRTNNRVLQKLTRAPRYFDPPESSPQTYDKHDGVEKSKAHKTRKPCYICAEIGHDGLRCKKIYDCFICYEKGHRVADCSNKNAEVDCTSRLCLKCGNTGHDMFTCTNGYDPEDLKAIKCYNCQKFGHLCCVEEKTEGPRGSSCYNCGQSGHFGSECTVPASGVLCSKCGDKCHPPDRCTEATSAKPVKKKAAAAAAAATKAAKRRSRNARRRKRANPVPTVTAYQSQPNGWWIAPTVGPYYGNPGSNVWLSPAAAAGSNLNHQIGTLPSHQHIINNQGRLGSQSVSSSGGCNCSG